MAAKPVGAPGDWFAELNGERIPCVHKYWVKGLHHRAENAWQNDPQHIRLVDAIREKGRVLLTKDIVTGHGEAFKRDGYIAHYRVNNLKWENDVLEFDLVEKLQSWKAS